MNIDSKDQQGIPVGDGRVSNETLCGDNNSDKSKDMLRLLMWPIEHMQSAIKKCKEEWDSESERRLKDKVAAKIYIQDASVDGKIVVALKVNGVVIDYARHSEDKDPEGFRIYNGVDTLIEKMQTIRINEYVRLKMTKNKIVVKNYREQAHVERYNSMMEQLRRKTMERGDSAYSEYIIFVGSMAAIAEDATVEALKYFMPSNKEKKAIMALPKQQRKSYIKEHWPYYQNELKQIMRSIDVSFFEKTAVASANKLDREILQCVMDSAQEKLKRDVYLLRQAVKRAMGRVKDKNGNHMRMMEEKSFLYVATMLWMRVCACHDVRMKMGPTPVGEDRNEEVKEYITEWTKKNHELVSEGKEPMVSRYYSANFDTAMKPFRPTRITDMMLSLCKKIIGWWADTKDPMNNDIVKCDDIILRKSMSINFMENVTRAGIEDVERYKDEVEWLDKYCDEVNDSMPLSMPMLNCITVRLAGNTSTDHILEWLLRSNSNVGPNMFMDIKRVLLWLDTKIPAAVEPERPLTDEEKYAKVVELMYAADKPSDMLAEIEKLGDERLVRAWKESVDECNEHFAKKREDELREQQKQVAYENLKLQQQEPEPKIRRERWKDEDARWMLWQIERGIMTPDEVAERFGRTKRAIYDKIHRMRQARMRAATSVQPLRILKT